MILFVTSGLSCPAWADAARCERRQYVVAWNHWHPDERRGVPALVEPERIPRNADEFDAWLALMIAEAMLEE